MFQSSNSPREYRDMWIPWKKVPLVPRVRSRNPSIPSSRKHLHGSNGRKLQTRDRKRHPIRPCLHDPGQRSQSTGVLLEVNQAISRTGFKMRSLRLANSVESRLDYCAQGGTVHLQETSPVDWELVKQWGGLEALRTFNHRPHRLSQVPKEESRRTQHPMQSRYSKNRNPNGEHRECQKNPPKPYRLKPHHRTCFRLWKHKEHFRGCSTIRKSRIIWESNFNVHLPKNVQGGRESDAEDQLEAATELAGEDEGSWDEVRRGWGCLRKGW